MSEWIRANEVFKLAGKPDAFARGSNLAIAICKRAYAGMLRTKADRLILQDRVRDDAELPTEFWWAEGHAALVQDWQSGDFSTCLNQGRGSAARAFGVSFYAKDLQPILDGHASPLGLAATARANASASPRTEMITEASGKGRAGRKPDNEKWKSFYFAVIELAQAGRLTPDQFQSAASLGDEVLEMMGEGAFSPDHVKATVSQIYKKFVGS